MACRKAGSRPASVGDLRAAAQRRLHRRARCPAEGFRWVYEQLGRDVSLASISGGTDVCTAFVGGSPARCRSSAGEISCRCLGAEVEAFDERGHGRRRRAGRAGRHRADAVDAGRLLGRRRRIARYRADLLRRLPRACGATATGSRITERGTCVITGRSDATLNRGGVRLGTASSTRWSRRCPRSPTAWSCTSRTPTDGTGELLPVRRWRPGATLDDDARERGSPRALRTELSPRHVPDRIDRRCRPSRGRCRARSSRCRSSASCTGTAVDRAAAKGSLVNPESLAFFEALARAGRDGGEPAKAVHGERPCRRL